MRSKPKLTARRTDQNSPSTVSTDARCEMLPPLSMTQCWKNVCANGMRIPKTIDNPNPISAHVAAPPSSFLRAMTTAHPNTLTISIGSCPKNIVTKAVICDGSFNGFNSGDYSARRVAGIF